MVLETSVIPIPPHAMTNVTAPDVVRNKLGATSDTHAVAMWLAQQKKPETRRQYELHARRLLAWLQTIDRSLDSCTFMDMSTYLEQLDNSAALSAHIARYVPFPDQVKYRRLFASKSDLVSSARTSRKPKKPSLRTLPSSKPLARAFRARKILVSMFRWLQESGYISTFAMPRPQLPTTTQKNIQSEPATTQSRSTATVPDDTVTLDLRREQIRSRLLSDAQWATVDQAIEKLDWTVVSLARCRLVATWLRESGVRRAELAGARYEHMEWVQHPKSGTRFWLWKVIGKGDKVRHVPLTPAMMDSYKRYRLAHGLPYFEHDAFLAVNPTSFIFVDRDAVNRSQSEKRRVNNKAEPVEDTTQGSTREHSPLTGATIYRDVCRLAHLAATSNPPKIDERIAKLSPHWFRHRRAHDLLKKHHITKVAQYLGHASIETTKVYSFSEEVQLGHEILNGLAQ